MSHPATATDNAILPDPGQPRCIGCQIDNQAILDAVPDCMFQVGRTGVIEGFKPPGQESLLPAADMIGRNITAILPGDRAKPALDAIGRALDTGETRQFEFDIARGSDLAFFEARVSRVTDGHALIIVRDISERWRAEACDLSLLDIASKVQEEQPLADIIDLACRRIKSIFGINLLWVGRKEAGGAVKIFAGEDAGGWLKDTPMRWDNGLESNGLTGTAIRTGKYQVMSVRDPRLAPWRDWLINSGVTTGASFPLKVGGEILGALTMFTADEDLWTKRTIVNITNFAEQLALAIHVDNNRTRLRLLTAGLEAAANAIVITDRDGIVRWYNNAYLQLNGYSAADTAAGNVKLIESGLYPRSLDKAIWLHILKGRIWQGELPARRQDGSRFTAEVTITPVRDDTGEITNFTAIIQDITERKLVEKKMLEAREAVSRAERLGAMGIMAAGIAHEINQPLNSLKVMADGMLYWHRQGKVPSIDNAIQTIREISQEADRIDLIIKHMRAFISSSELSVPVPCDLNKAVEDSLSLIGAQLLSHGIEVRTELVPDLPPVFGAGTQLEQIVINLLVNAIHALDTVDKADKYLSIATGRKRGRVYLAVSDNGPGIPKELKRKIFDPFFTTNTAGTGMGLGLSIIHSIVTSHGGRIRVKDNKPSGGAAFWVEFVEADGGKKGDSLFEHSSRG